MYIYVILNCWLHLLFPILMRPSIHQAPPGPTSPSWAQWCIRCQGHPETPSLRRRELIGVLMGWWKQKAPCGMNLCYQDIFHISDYNIHMYIYIYVNSMILYITIYYYYNIYIYKVLVQSLALASMVSMAVSLLLFTDHWLAPRSGEHFLWSSQKSGYGWNGSRNGFSH